MEGKLIRSDRKTLCLRLTPTGELEIRAPRRMPLGQIEAFVREKSAWIEAHRQRILQERGQAEPLDDAAVRALKKTAMEKITPMLARHGKNMGVSYGTVTIRCQRARWGSCSAKGNLSFNCLLALAPEAVLEYVVVHELAHRKQMNHSSAFWREVGREWPEYGACRSWLKQNGGALLARVSPASAERSEP